jgi:uncharacterized Zn-binding protein involved in type VI secretion
MLLQEHYKGQKTRQLTFIQTQNTYTTSSLPIARYGRNGASTTKGSPVTNAKHIMALLQVATLPHKAAIFHCKGHQKDNTFISIGHNLADTTGKQVAQQMHPPGHSTNSL